jgi:RNA polymerase sigma factor FliA
MFANDEGSATGERDPKVCDLVQGALDLVDRVAKQVSRAICGAVEFDELVAAGHEGLFDAARRFDQQRHIPFRVYATYRVEGAIVDAVRKTLRLPRRVREQLAMIEAASLVNRGQRAEALRSEHLWSRREAPEVSLKNQLATIVTAAVIAGDSAAGEDESSGESQGANPEEAYARAELMAMVRAAISELDEYEAKLISLYYFESKSYEAAADAMKISRPRAHRLHTRAMYRLTKLLRSAIGD